MLVQVVPSDVVSVPTLRSAMGVTSEPIQATSVVDLSEDIAWQPGKAGLRPEMKQNELDQDLNDFFGRST